MNWLQKRLDDLNYTHQDLQHNLAELGINRVRETITGWTNGKPIALLSNPEDTQKLAQALNWTVMELLIEAGYDIGIPREMADFIHDYKISSPPKKFVFMKNISFVSGFLSAITDEELEISVDSFE